MVGNISSQALKDEYFRHLTVGRRYMNVFTVLNGHLTTPLTCVNGAHCGQRGLCHVRPQLWCIVFGREQSAWRGISQAGRQSPQPCSYEQNLIISEPLSDATFTDYFRLFPGGPLALRFRIYCLNVLRLTTSKDD